MLSLPELALYLDDRSEAYQCLHDLRIKAHDPRHPPKVPVAVVDIWRRKRRRTTD